MTSRAARSVGWLALASAVGCHSSSDQGALRVLTVDDPFTGPPAATTLDVDAIDDAGLATAMVHGGMFPRTSLDLGTYPDTQVGAVRVSGRAQDGSLVAWGQTLPFAFGGVAGGGVDVFVQRVSAFSRFPNPFTRARTAPRLGLLAGRYLVAAGGLPSDDAGSAESTDLYDLGTWTPLASPPTLARTPQSLALVGLAILAIDGTGGAWVDLSASDAGAVAPTETGIPWADVAGGATVTAPDGTAYVVGATRPPSLGPSAQVLRVSPRGALSVASLTMARAGAAAAWVPGRGLLVVVGQAAPEAGKATGEDGVSSAGIELLPAGAGAAASLPFTGLPPSSSGGFALAPLDGDRVVLIAGRAAWLLDLACASRCTPAPWGMELPLALGFAQAFTERPGTVLVIGEDDASSTHAYLMTPSSTTELPLRVPRQHARAVPLPSGGVALVGGAPPIESFVTVPP